MNTTIDKLLDETIEETKKLRLKARERKAAFEKIDSTLQIATEIFIKNPTDDDGVMDTIIFQTTKWIDKLMNIQEKARQEIKEKFDTEEIE